MGAGTIFFKHAHGKKDKRRLEKCSRLKSAKKLCRRKVIPGPGLEGGSAMKDVLGKQFGVLRDYRTGSMLNVLKLVTRAVGM